MKKRQVDGKLQVKQDRAKKRANLTKKLPKHKNKKGEKNSVSEQTKVLRKSAKVKLKRVKYIKDIYRNGNLNIMDGLDTEIMMSLKINIRLVTQCHSVYIQT